MRQCHTTPLYCQRGYCDDPNKRGLARRPLSQINADVPLGLNLKPLFRNGACTPLLFLGGRGMKTRLNRVAEIEPNVPLLESNSVVQYQSVTHVTDANKF